MYVMALPFRELEKMIYGSAAAVSEITQEAAAQPRERRLAFGEAELHRTSTGKAR